MFRISQCWFLEQKKKKKRKKKRKEKKLYCRSFSFPKCIPKCLYPSSQ